jgi:hypothetical protein
MTYPQQQPHSPYGPPPVPGPAPPPQKKRMSTVAIVALVFGGLAALCCVGGVVMFVSGGNDSDTNASNAEEVAVREAKGDGEPGIGTPARDGKFEFVVSKVDCGKTSVGDDLLGKQAQGQFCLVSMSVKNIGDSAKTLDSSSQYAYDASDRKFDADGVASMYANDNNELFLNEINPGNQVDAVLVFDVPKDTKLAKVELHDSIFSGGVTVKVG